PHFWLDARNMAVYVENIRDALIGVDPEGAQGYRARTVEVVAELEALHQELLTTMAEIPAERRHLVMFHDAFQYFAAAYEFEVIATVAPANPNQARSAAAIAEIIGIVQGVAVPTIYREPQYNSQSLDLIAVDSGASIGIIHSIPSPDAPTYAEMMRANARALVDGLAPRN
ncbi:MAG: metal ABC transporter substrate-binding protein, partial [Dehalococcoidia bacterium]